MGNASGKLGEVMGGLGMLRGGFGRLVDTCREKAFLSSVSLFHQRWQRIGIRILRFFAGMFAIN